MPTRALLLLLITACGDNHLSSADASSDNDVDARQGSGAPDASLAPDAAVTDASTADAFGVELACTLTELQPLLTCAQTSCAMNPTLTCVATSCGLLVFGLSPSCRTCVLTALTSQDPAATAAACGLGVPGI